MKNLTEKADILVVYLCEDEVTGELPPFLAPYLQNKIMIQDLLESKMIWLYSKDLETDMFKKCLVQIHTVSENEVETKKGFKGLGEKTMQILHSKKVKHATFWFSKKIKIRKPHSLFS